MLAATFHRDLEIGAAEQRIVRSGVEPQRRLTVIAESLLDIELQNLPGGSGISTLGRIGSRLDCDGRDIAGELMMAVAVLWRSGETRDHNQRSKRAYGPNGVACNDLFIPFLFRLSESFRKSVVIGPRKVLFGPVERAGLQEFLGTDHTERFKQLRTDNILSTVTARQRKICRASVFASGKICEQRRIFVVRMSTDHHHARRRLNAFQKLAQTQDRKSTR